MFIKFCGQVEDICICMGSIKIKAQCQSQGHVTSQSCVFFSNEKTIKT